MCFEVDDMGQARFVQVRGATARWSSVSFDNVTVVGAEERVFRLRFGLSFLSSYGSELLNHATASSIISAKSAGMLCPPLNSFIETRNSLSLK